MKIILQVSGSISKNVMATAVCRAIRSQYPKDQLIVITEYPITQKLNHIFLKMITRYPPCIQRE
jgi:hypothetical protein